MKIVIDPGHGGYDPGAIGPNGLREADVSLQVALRLASILEQAGASIKLTRDSDIAPGGSNDVNRDLQARCEIANSWPADYYVSIHCNSAGSPAAGIETYCYKYGGMGEKLARAIQAELVAATGRNDRGVKEANFYVLRRTNMPAVLVELAFISNPEEERLLGQAGYQQRCALAISRAITRTLGLPVPQEEGGGKPPVTTNTPKPGVFKDVSPTDWAAEDLEWLAQKGLLAGDTNGNFRPDAPLTRREGAVLMARILKFLGVK